MPAHVIAHPTGTAAGLHSTWNGRPNIQDQARENRTVTTLSLRSHQRVRRPPAGAKNSTAAGSGGRWSAGVREREGLCKSSFRSFDVHVWANVSTLRRAQHDMPMWRTSNGKACPLPGSGEGRIRCWCITLASRAGLCTKWYVRQNMQKQAGENWTVTTLPLRSPVASSTRWCKYTPID